MVAASTPSVGDVALDRAVLLVDALEERRHRLVRRLEVLGRLARHRVDRLGVGDREPVDERRHGAGGGVVVGGDLLGGDAGQPEQHRGHHAGAVLAGRAVEQQRRAVGGELDDAGDGGAAAAQHVDVALAEEVDRAGGGHEVVLGPHPLEDRQVVPVDRVVLDGEPAAALDLADRCGGRSRCGARGRGPSRGRRRPAGARRRLGTAGRAGSSARPRWGARPGLGR